MGEVSCGWSRSVRRGDIHVVDFEPIRGSEANKTRPAVVVSNDQANSAAERFGRGVVTVVPLTSNTQRVASFQVLLERAATGLNKDSKAQVEQMRAVAIERVGRRVGSVPRGLLPQIDAAIRLHLAL